MGMLCARNTIERKYESVVKNVEHATVLDITQILLIAVLLLIINICLLAGISRKHILRYKKMTVTDPITGGLNHTGFLQESAKYFNAGSASYVVVTMQILNYHQIIKAFGCEKVDQTIVHLYNVVRENLSSSEPIARTDSNTFCFLLKNRQEAAVRARLSRIYESAIHFEQKNWVPCQVDLTFGIYTPNRNVESMDDILKKSVAFLENRESDSRYHFFQTDAEEPPNLKLEKIFQMEQALKNGEFVVFMQPKVRLGDDRIVAAEALLRWRHPQQGLLTPDVFIPLLNEYHLLPQYDLYLMEQVCRQISQWIRQDWTPMPVSLNLSCETLRTSTFAKSYAQLCEKYGVAPELIELELPASVLMNAPQEILPAIEQIHSFGFRCALDNFGKNVIPLSFLRDLNIDTIKLDQKLFSSESNNRRNRFVVEAILKLATQMQIRTVAEGIDNASQIQYLKQAGCDMVQGFYFFQPMPMEEFCIRAFHKGQPGYAEGTEKKSAQALQSAERHASNKITMFSLHTSADQIAFSNLFSPVQEEKYVLSNASSLFQYSALIHENDQKDFFRLLERCKKENGWVENTIRFYTARDRYEWLEVHMHREITLPDEEMIFSGVLVNMAGWKNEVNRWKEKANRDVLTGLYNREFFEQTVSSAVEKGIITSAAIIFVDIDNFKKVNDMLGHVVGDDVICSTAKRLLGTFRHSDVVARYGGDEFVVFVNGISREDLAKRLQQLCDSFRYPYRNNNIEYPVSTSIGAAVFPEDGKSYLQLLDHADSALYVAKRQGKNQFVFYHPDYEGLSE